MKLELFSKIYGSELGLCQAVSLAILGLARGSEVVAIVALAGCAARVEPHVQYVRVEVPVQVPCRAPEVAVPPWAAAGLRKTDSLELKVRALLADRLQRIGYEKQITAALVACQH